MAKKKRETSDVQKAYAKGYAAGLKKNRTTGSTVIHALRGQVEYWEQRYRRLRRELPPSVGAVDPHEGTVDAGPRAKDSLSDLSVAAVTPSPTEEK